MALINCPNCGKEISDKSQQCIHCGASLNRSIKRICPECGKEVDESVSDCPFCGCPLSAEQQADEQAATVAEKPKKKKRKVIIPILIILVVVIAICSAVGVNYYTTVIVPKNTYDEAIALLESGKYEEANELFDTIQDYEDVATLQIQLKYESYAYDCINALKEYLKNPDSYQPYDISFYELADEEDTESDTEGNDSGTSYPTCIMHYGAQNGFGGNTTGYALFSYDEEEGGYEFIGSCDSVDLDDYEDVDEDDESEVYEAFVCALINGYLSVGEEVGDIDMTRLKTILKNDAYSTIKIIE